MREASAPAPTHSPQDFVTGTPSRQGPRPSPPHRPLGCPRRRAQAALLEPTGPLPFLRRGLRSTARSAPRQGPRAAPLRPAVTHGSSRNAQAPQRRRHSCYCRRHQIPHPPTAPTVGRPARRAALYKTSLVPTSLRRAGGGTSPNDRAQSADCALQPGD